MFTVKSYVNGVLIETRRLNRTQWAVVIALVLTAWASGGTFKIEIEYTVTPPRVGDEVPPGVTP